ncbi:MAG TPA: Gx transporter family protein [Clostridia bacterium]|nr:Gx transporter family protein [Clostridia bacterium]
MKRRGAGNIARLGLIACVAVVLGYVDSLLPLPAIPGVKLGLANCALLYALYFCDAGSAFLLMLLKVGLSGLLYGGVPAMAYSLAGGALSLAAMLLARRAKDLSVVGVSVTGALLHNIGQMAVACLVVESRALLAYLPVLLVSAAVTGTLTGLAATYTMRALEKARAHAKDAVPGDIPEETNENKP